MRHGPLTPACAPLWADLVATALLGTERRAPALPVAGGALGDLLGRLAPGDDPAGALLGAAAAVALYRRAGWLPPASAAQPFPPAPPDDLPPCSARAGAHLAQMLAGTYAAALPEWLAALASAGRAAPASLLPALLDHGRNHEDLRPVIVAALGARGRWLAGLNPDWEYASGAGAAAQEDATPLWETGSPAARLMLLAGLRAREPERARDLLAASWASEKVDDRERFLAALAQGLCMADEPFLEQALNDRSERVRKAAADLLATLPESALAQRMAARVAPLLRWQPGRLLQRASIDVALPEEYDKAMQRDGIVRKPARSGMGEKAWWLSQMIEQIPPDAWCKLWGASPDEILKAKLPKEWRDLLLSSLSEAARRHGDQEWLEALIALRRADKKPGELAELLPALPPARREALALALLQAHQPLAGDHPALAALRSLAGPWGHDLSRAVLAALRRRLLASDKSSLRTDWRLHSALELFATRMPADLAAKVGAIISDELPPWGGAITQFEELMRFRDAMLRALRES
ncbi:hypothetical protein K2Z83_25905 [Oscillochloris sp. ZM17-4]|uniref:DUF5691 domain-containing protein n=1 Tax=Oscillochloris sp. ZM17-4 TaxID=2866714 RepID=UPI001C72B083|nr:DUF5691 domain-containing protein [Oscillochloris sp. ZM17-4]MBX0331090.1 hypothetical protein [Oscillochloris sp. ZM17-4]